MGGEKILEPSMGVGNFGSPPHGRGKAVKFRCTCGLQRITPAWAGKRPTRPNVEFEVKDHPRVGGEKARTLIVQNEPQGSPPRRRGKDLGCKVGSRQPGITPAWAGKSMTAPGRSSRTGDHPRVGGEKAPAAGHCSTDTGSPPHRRGKG